MRSQVAFGIVLMACGPGTGGSAIQVPAPSEQNSYVENHACLVEGDCTRLSYICGSGYCDEVSILARSAKPNSTTRLH